MPGETDQTRWVGTRKVYPAIGDLGAITDHVSRNWYANAQDCTVEKFISLAAVPSGEIWIVTNILMRNETSLCDMEISIKDGVAIRPFCSWYSIPAMQNMTWNGIVVLMGENLLRGYYRLGGATDDFRLWAQGWKIEEY